MTRRTLSPVTRAEAKRILAQPIRDVEVARLAASYLDVLDIAIEAASYEGAYQNYDGDADEYMTKTGWDEEWQS